MRPYSPYLESVKKPRSKTSKINLAGTTPPQPKVPKRLDFDARESRQSPALSKLVGQIASLYSVHPNRLSLSAGSSSAFLHALASLTHPGETILVERPYYEPFVAAAKFLSLKVAHFQRTGDIDRDLAKLKTKCGRTRVLVLSNPHSPTGFLYSKADIERISRLFAFVIVDEIFLPVFTGEISRTGSLANVISISGLSKTLGLSSLRIGWMKASPEIVRQSERMAINTYVDLPTLSLVGAGAVLPRWERIVESHRTNADLNRKRLQAFDKRYPRVLSHDFAMGHFGVLAIPREFESGSDFAKELKRRHSIAVCPCELFGLRRAVRFNSMIEPSKFKRALSAIASYYD